MNYIDLSRGGVMVSASGNALPVAERLHFVDAQTQNFAFTFWKCGTVWEIPAGAALVMVGNPTENSTTAVFYATGAIAADRKSVTFAVDTYTAEYFAAITRSGTALYVDIIMASGTGPADSVRLSRLDAIADVRVLKPGATPPPAITGTEYITAVDVMPEASAERVGQVVLYTGATGGDYLYGAFYVCAQSAVGQVWRLIDNGTSSEVASVNGKVGAVWLDASDVGAIEAPVGGSAGQALLKTENGTEWSTVVGPEGPEGPEGPQGETGPAGADGADGADGASAYEIAVEHGYSGTEEQWLASLKGATGATGATGPQGPPGPAPAGGSPGQVITKTASGEVWADVPVQSVNSKTGAVVLDAGDVGAIPAPAGGSSGQVLTKTASGEEWATPSAYTLPDATTSSLGGVMVDGSTVLIASGGVISVACDSALNSSSPLPVANSAVTAALADKVNATGGTLTSATLGGSITVNSPIASVKSFAIADVPASNTDEAVFIVQDANAANVARAFLSRRADGSVVIALGVFNNIRGGNNFASISIGVDASGNALTAAPSPAAGDNSTRIATTEFIAKGKAIVPLDVSTGSATIAVLENVAYTCAPTATTSIGLQAVLAGYCRTCELWITQPATPVTVTLPSSILWDDGTGYFASGNSAPAMSTGNRLYCLVIRRDGTNWLGNLAYTKEVTA